MENKVHRSSKASNKSSNRESLQGEKEELEFYYNILETPILNYLENPLNSGYQDFESIKNLINLKIESRKGNNDFKLKFNEISKSTNCFQLNQNADCYVGDNILIYCRIINTTNNQIIYKDILITDENDKKKKINIKLSKNPLNNLLNINESLYFNIALKNTKEDLKIGIKFVYKNVIIKKNHYEIISDDFFEKKFNIQILKPFEIETNFYHFQMEKYYLRINIKNLTKFPIFILDINILYEFNEGNYLLFIDKNNFEESFLDRNEEISFIFPIDEYNILLKQNLYIVNILWKKYNEFIKRDYLYTISNNLSIFSQNYILKIKEKPDKIEINSIFNIVFNFQSNEDFSNIQINLIKNFNEKEIEILSIKDKIFNCKKNESKDITFICKNYFKGSNIFFPTFFFSCDQTKKFEKIIEFECENNI